MDLDYVLCEWRWMGCWNQTLQYMSRIPSISTDLSTCEVTSKSVPEGTSLGRFMPAFYRPTDFARKQKQTPQFIVSASGEWSFYRIPYKNIDIKILVRFTILTCSLQKQMKIYLFVTLIFVVVHGPHETLREVYSYSRPSSKEFLLLRMHNPELHAMIIESSCFNQWNWSISASRTSDTVMNWIVSSNQVLSTIFAKDSQIFKNFLIDTISLWLYLCQNHKHWQTRISKNLDDHQSH